MNLSHHDYLKGVWTALVTPMTLSGDIDWNSFDKLLEQQIDAKVTGVVLAGTTGESQTLSVQEKLSLVRRAKARAGAHLQIMAGTGGSCTQSAKELSVLAEEAGAQSLLVVTPPYCKPSFDGLMSYYKTIHDATKIPVCLYHIPSRTGQALSAAQIMNLCELERISMIKEGSGDIGLAAKLAVKNQKKKILLSGDDLTFLPFLAAGGEGIISVASNIIPKTLVDIWNAFKQGSIEDAKRLYLKALPLMEALFIETNPAPTKALLATEYGIGSNTLRSPLAPVQKQNLESLRAVFAHH